MSIDQGTDFEVPEAFLLADGPDRRVKWIADPLLSSMEMRKFSDICDAGVHDDVDGMSCDAFAHFSLHDSKGQLVFCDIQGPFVPQHPETCAHSSSRNCHSSDEQRPPRLKSVGTVGSHGTLVSSFTFPG